VDPSDRRAVSNFPATQSVSGTVTISNVANREFSDQADIDAHETHSFVIPNGINAIWVHVIDFSVTAENVQVFLKLASGATVTQYFGETPYSHDYTLPVAISAVGVTCLNDFLSCNVAVEGPWLLSPARSLSRGPLLRDPGVAHGPEVAGRRHPASGGFELPRRKPALGRFRVHVRADKPVPDRRPTGLVDAPGIGSAGMG
jgi:hypothetical protein